MSDLLTNLDVILETEQDTFSFVGPGDAAEIASILGQSDYNNIIYVGRSGVGKTANIFGLAQAQKEDPETSSVALPLHMISREFYIMNVGETFAGSDEQIRENIKEVFKELSKPGCSVLVIEDANDFLEAIEDHNVPGVVSSFMGELRKGTFQCIWMVREVPGLNSKLTDVLECHSDVEELFTVLRKEPAEHDNILRIVGDRSKVLERHHQGLTINEDAATEIVELTLAYPSLAIYQREQPARALRMLDSIASRFITNTTQNNGGAEQWKEAVRKLQALNKDKNEAELLKLKQENILAEEAQKTKERLEEDLHVDREIDSYDMSIAKSSETREAEEMLRHIAKELNRIMPAIEAVKDEVNTSLTLDISAVRSIFAEISGIPSGDLNDNESEKVMAIEATMKKHIYGQDEAVETIAGAIKRAHAGLKEADEPIGGFILLGSSGVGKTYLGEILAETLFGDRENFTSFDMSEFMEKHTIAKLIGAPPGYAGYGSGGALTNTVREKPYQVILLDEVEKAHPDVFKILLQVLDKGRLSDELGTADFTNTIILLTTNIAQHLSLEGADPSTEETRETVIEELRAIFPQELINRVDDFLLFNALLAEHIEAIVRREIKKINKRLAKRTAVTVVLDEASIKKLVEEKYKKEEGSRQVLKFIGNNLERKVADIVLNHPEGGAIVATYDGVTFELTFEANDEISV
jgi:ATP-dependent Clp protease ATP-binding subunit ClpA